MSGISFQVTDHFSLLTIHETRNISCTQLERIFPEPFSKVQHLRERKAFSPFWNHLLSVCDVPVPVPARGREWWLAGPGKGGKEGLGNTEDSCDEIVPGQKASLWGQIKCTHFIYSTHILIHSFFHSYHAFINLDIGKYNMNKIKRPTIDCKNTAECVKAINVSWYVCKKQKR